MEPTKSGRAFLGWNTQSNGSGALYSAGSDYLVPDPESGSVTLYAQWNTYPYTVVYDLQDGESADNLTQGGVFSSAIILSLPTPDEREGFRFDGWNAAADGSGDTYADGDTYATPDRITLAPYSSGGQRVFQYGWQDVGVGDTVEYVEWQTTSTDGDRPLRKPNVAAVGSGNFLTLDSEGDPQETGYAGTSHSAAAVAGIAALYWELRASQLATIDTDVTPLGAATIASMLPEEVRAALRDAGQYDGADPYVPTSPFDLTQSVLIGDGAIDVPTVVSENLFAQPLNVNSITHATGVAAIKLDFTKSPDDFLESFAYWVECEGLSEPVDPTLSDIPNPNGAYVVPSDSSSPTGAITSDFLPDTVTTVAKAPLVRDAAPGNDVVCSITPQRDSEKWTPSIIATAVINPVDASPFSISLAPKALGVDLLLTDTTEYPIGTVLTYVAQCSAVGADPAADPLWSSDDVPAGATQSIAVDAGTEVTCSATVTAQYESATARTAESSPTSVTAMAAAVSAPTVTVTPDLGGVLISWSTDPDLASAVSQALSLTCTQGDQTLLDAEVMSADATDYFLEAEDDAPVECTITSTMTAGTDIEVVESSSAEQATPEPSSSGLPVWLMYQATQ